MKRFKFRLLDYFVVAAAIALIWNGKILGVSLGLITVSLYLLVRFKLKSATKIARTAASTDEDNTSPVESEEDNTFVVDDEDPARVSIELDVDLHWRPLNNHFC